MSETAILHSKDLLADKTLPLRRLEFAERERLLADSGFFTGESQYIFSERQVDWWIHEGDLHLDRHFQNAHELVVTGDLIIEGDYVDYIDMGYLIVQGNLRARNVLTERDLAVGGDLIAENLVYAQYNDCCLSVNGAIQCPLLINNDHSVFASEYRTELSIGMGANQEHPGVFLNPETTLADIRELSYQDPDSAIEVLSHTPDIEHIHRLIDEDIALVRKDGPLHWLAEEAQKALSSDGDPESLITLAQKDRFIFACVLIRPDCPDALIDSVLDGDDPFLMATLACKQEGLTAPMQSKLIQRGASIALKFLAKNKTLDPSLMPALMERCPSSAPHLASHENSSPSLWNIMANSRHSEVRFALFWVQTELPSALLERLAGDEDSNTKIRLIRSPDYLRRLSRESIERLVSDPDERVRVELLRLPERLTKDDFEQLFQDTREAVQIALAEHLRDQAIGRIRSAIPSARRAEMALTLSRHQHRAVWMNAAHALSAEEQEKLVDKVKQQDKPKLIRMLARATHSDAIARRCISSGDEKTLLALANSRHIKASTQKLLVEKIQRDIHAEAERSREQNDSHPDHEPSLRIMKELLKNRHVKLATKWRIKKLQKTLIDNSIENLTDTAKHELGYYLAIKKARIYAIACVAITLAISFALWLFLDSIYPALIAGAIGLALDWFIYRQMSKLISATSLLRASVLEARRNL